MVGWTAPPRQVNRRHSYQRGGVGFALVDLEREERRPIHPVPEDEVAVNADDADRNWYLRFGRLAFDALRKRLGCRERMRPIA